MVAFDKDREEATQLRLEPLRPDEDEEATAVLRPVPAPPCAPHRTREEAEDTASVEMLPLRLDQVSGAS